MKQESTQATVRVAIDSDGKFNPEYIQVAPGEDTVAFTAPETHALRLCINTPKLFGAKTYCLEPGETKELQVLPELNEPFKYRSIMQYLDENCTTVWALLLTTRGTGEGGGDPKK